MRRDAEPFDYPGDERGVLCIHGFTGTPFEMHHLGRRLAERGLTVSGPVLAGHGSAPDKLDATTWRDWFWGVERAFDALRRRCRRVAVVGQSLGGLLALHLARRRGPQVAALASLAAPLWLTPPARAVAWLTRPGGVVYRAVGRIPKVGGSDCRDPAMRGANPSYRVIPMRAFHELTDFIEIVRDNLAAVRAPALVVHGRNDHTAPFACAEYLVARLGSEIVRFRPLERSYHLVAIDVERAIVADEVGAFFEEQLGAAAATTTARRQGDRR